MLIRRTRYSDEYIESRKKSREAIGISKTNYARVPLPILADLVSIDFNNLVRIDRSFELPRITLLHHMALSSYLKASFIGFEGETDGLASLTDQTTNLLKFFENGNVDAAVDLALLLLFPNKAMLYVWVRAHKAQMVLTHDK